MSSFCAVVPALALWFIAMQSSLSYATAAIAKIVSPVWRNGAALRQIFNTKTFGSRRIASVLRDVPQFAWAACWLVILVELLIACSILFPPPATAALLALGLAFHLANAILLSLNTFPWTWAATYPAMFFCSIQTHAVS